MSLKRVRNRYKGTDFVVISKVHALRVRHNSPYVEVIVRQL